MPIQFPTNPEVNQEYTYEGKVWKWDGSAWVGVRIETGIQKSNIWSKQNLLIPNRKFGLNSGYNGATDQRRTQAGTIPMLKHYMERDLGEFESNLENIVTSGLVLRLDAGNPTSYPGSGTVWTDLSGNGNDGTLVNGVGYTGDNGGSLVFDGVDDYVSCGNDSSLSFTNNFTIQIWCSSNNGSSYRSPLMKSTSGSWNDGYGFYQFGGSFVFFVNAYNGAQGTSVSRTTFPITQIVGTYDGANLKYYENGTLIQTGSSFTSNVNNSSTDLEIGRGGGSSYYWDGNIAQVSLYNRALTGLEVTQNYNAHKSRYGL